MNDPEVGQAESKEGQHEAGNFRGLLTLHSIAKVLLMTADVQLEACSNCDIILQSRVPAQTRVELMELEL